MFTKRLHGLKNKTYSERLAILDGSTLELRRVKADLVMYYKIIHGLLPVENMFNQRRLSVTRGNSLKLYINKMKTNKERFLFKNRAVHIWNSLPDFIVIASNVKSFKYHLDRLELKFFNSCLHIK